MPVCAQKWAQNLVMLLNSFPNREHQVDAGQWGNIEPFAMQCCGGTEIYAKLYIYAEQFEALAAIRYKLPQGLMYFRSMLTLAAPGGRPGGIALLA